MTTHLLQGIAEPEDKCSDEEWLAELNRRAAQVRRGALSSKPWLVVQAELLAKLCRYRADAGRLAPSEDE